MHVQRLYSLNDRLLVRIARCDCKILEHSIAEIIARDDLDCPIMPGWERSDEYLPIEPGQETVETDNSI